MMNFGGKRRSGQAFAHLASKAGLKILSISRQEGSNHAMIEMILV
jgi:hypothetical protein